MDEREQVGAEVSEETVRDALGHLYDNAHLMRHPLMARLVRHHLPDPLARVQQVRSTIIEAIHSLAPPTAVPAKSKEWRPYGVVIYRYIDRMSDERIERELSISERQLYRDLKTGIALLTARLNAVAAVEAGQERDALADSLQEVGLRLERLDLNALGSQVLPLVQDLCTSLGKAIRFQPAPGEVVAVADAVLSRQALISALSYALHQARGGVTLQVVAHEAAHAVVLCFEAEADASPAHLPEALRLARRLLEEQGGCLQCQEARGELTVGLRWGRFVEPTILIVDDDAAMLRLFSRYLGTHGYRVVCSSDGSQVPLLVTETGARLVILDVMMRDMDGWSVLRQAKADPRLAGVPVLVCSVIDDPSLALALGATALLAKPVRQEQLLRAVMEIVGI